MSCFSGCADQRGLLSISSYYSIPQLTSKYPVPTIHVTFSTGADANTLAPELIKHFHVVQTPAQKKRLARYGVLSGAVEQSGAALDQLLREIRYIPGVNWADADRERGIA